MKFDREWSQFAVDGETEHYGVKRIVDAHNKLRLVAEQFIAVTELYNQSPFDELAISKYNAAKRRLQDHLG